MSVKTSQLLSGRAPVVSPNNVTADRYQFLGLNQAEPNLGYSGNGNVLTTDIYGGRTWSSNLSVNTVNTYIVKATTLGNVGTTVIGSLLQVGNILINASGNIQIANAYGATSTTTGALVVAGGVGIGGNLWVGANLIVQGNLTVLGNLTTLNVETINTTEYVTQSYTSIQSVGNISGVILGNVGSTVNGSLLQVGNILINASGNIQVSNSYPSTSTTSGAVVVKGGMGVVGNVYVGRDLVVTGTITGNNIPNTYTLPNTSGISPQWVRLGTFTAAQGGYDCFIQIVTSSGQNALTSQDTVAYLHFKTSNGFAVDANGFAGDSYFYRTGPSTTALTGIKVQSDAAGVAATAFTFFANLSSYTGDASFYMVEIGSQNTSARWTNNPATVADPGAASSSIQISEESYTINSPFILNGGFSANAISVGNISAKTIGNSGATVNADTVNSYIVNAVTLGNTASFHTGSTAAFGNIAAVTIGNTGAFLTGSTAAFGNIAAVNFGNTGAVFNAANITITGVTPSGSGGGLYVSTSANVVVNNTAPSTSSTTGVIVVRGGVGVSGQITSGGNILVTSTGNLVVANTAASTTNTTGALVVTGGVGVSGQITSGGNILVTSTGNLVVANTAVSTSTSTGSFIVTGGAGIQGNLNVGVGYTASSTHIFNGNLSIVGNIINGGVSGIGNIGSVGTTFNTVFARSTTASYADLAEMYIADYRYNPGIVVEFGGTHEVTECDSDMSQRVAGVVSTSPAYLMNSHAEGQYVVAIALVGRVQTKCLGPVKKGDMMVSAGNGQARAEKFPQIGTVIGKSLEDLDSATGTIEIVVGSR
jgi:hypothetical protein